MGYMAWLLYFCVELSLIWPESSYLVAGLVLIKLGWINIIIRGALVASYLLVRFMARLSGILIGLAAFNLVV